MKRPRRLFKVLAAVSLVLCALTVPAWLLSRWLVVVVSYVHTDPPASAPVRLKHYFIRIGEGGVGIDGTTFVPLNAADAVQWAAPTPVPRGVSLNHQWLDFKRTAWRWAASYFVTRPQYGAPWTATFDGVESSTTSVSVYIPYWLMTLAFGILPGLELRRWRTERRRVRRGLCATCGYDLRATPDRCPECGTVPENAKGAAG